MTGFLEAQAVEQLLHLLVVLARGAQAIGVVGLVRRIPFIVGARAQIPERDPFVVFDLHPYRLDPEQGERPAEDVVALLRAQRRHRDLGVAESLGGRVLEEGDLGHRHRPPRDHEIDREPPHEEQHDQHEDPERDAQPETTGP